MQEREPLRLPNRGDHDLRVYSAIVGPPKPANGHDSKIAGSNRRWRTFILPEWSNVQRMLTDSSLPPHVRAKLAPLLERAHRRWCEAFDRLTPQPQRKSDPNRNGSPVAPTKLRGDL